MVICQPSQQRHLETPQSADMDLFVCPFVVIQDTREQAPWTFQNIIIERRLWVVRRVVATLTTGDYTIQGCEDRLVIERKSGDDLVGSVTAGNARFRREHERMLDVVKFGGDSGGFACVVVEDSLSRICDELDQDQGRRVTGDMILAAYASWPQKYGVHWKFAGDRRTAEKLAFRVMLKFWKEHHE